MIDMQNFKAQMLRFQKLKKAQSSNLDAVDQKLTGDNIGETTPK